MQQFQNILFRIFISVFFFGFLNFCEAQTISAGATFSVNSGNYVFGIIGISFSGSSKNLVLPGFSTETINSNKNSVELNINTFPNPVSDILKIEIPNLSKTETVSVTIFDISGLSVYEKWFDIKNFDIDFSHFRTGIYFLEISTDKNIRTITKIKVVKI
jgi:hypothetical protein